MDNTSSSRRNRWQRRRVTMTSLEDYDRTADTPAQEHEDGGFPESYYREQMPPHWGVKK